MLEIKIRRKDGYRKFRVIEYLLKMCHLRQKEKCLNIIKMKGDGRIEKERKNPRILGYRRENARPSCIVFHYAVFRCLVSHCVIISFCNTALRYISSYFRGF